MLLKVKGAGSVSARREQLLFKKKLSRFFIPLDKALLVTII